MGKHKILRLALPIMIMLLTSGCAIKKSPAEILAFSAFYMDYHSGDIGFYIDWRNFSNEKTVDFLILSVSFASEDTQPLRYRILEPEGIAPGEHNRTNRYEIKQYELPSMEITSLEVSILQIGYTDGSVWKNGDNPSVVSAEIDGKKGCGAFPVQINEAVFYASSETSPFIDFQADWTNLSETESIIDVVYKITAKSSYGTAIPAKDGAEAIYAADDFSASKQPAPGSDYHSDKKSIMRLLFSREDAAIYEISVCKAVDSNGTVWENSDESDRIAVIFCGKKGYRFGDNVSNPSIQALVHRIAEESQKYDLDLEEPEIFVREHNYCILRYAGVDIRAELSETNEVLPDKVGFIYYSKGLHKQTEANLLAYLDKMRSLRLCICAAALTELPYEEVIQKVEEYNKNSESQIDFEDPAYATYETGNSVLDKYGVQNPCGVFAVGKDLYDPLEAFFWAGENPYDSQDAADAD